MLSSLSPYLYSLGPIHSGSSLYCKEPMHPLWVHICTVRDPSALCPYLYCLLSWPSLSVVSGSIHSLSSVLLVTHPLLMKVEEVGNGHARFVRVVYLCPLPFLSLYQSPRSESSLELSALRCKRRSSASVIPQFVICSHPNQII